MEKIPWYRKELSIIFIFIFLFPIWLFLIFSGEIYEKKYNSDEKIYEKYSQKAIIFLAIIGVILFILNTTILWSLINESYMRKSTGFYKSLQQSEYALDETFCDYLKFYLKQNYNIEPEYITYIGENEFYFSHDNKDYQLISNSDKIEIF